MRQSQQKSRARGRGGRKQQNPLNRNFESNGPDVKIRGNAGHIAEKYTSLARDALSNGDTVMAENYLQHAEHYNRIIASAQAAQQQQQELRQDRRAQPDIDQPSGEPVEDVEANASDTASSAQPEESDNRPRRGRPRRTRRNETSDSNGTSHNGSHNGAHNGNDAGGLDMVANGAAHDDHSTKGSSASGSNDNESAPKEARKPRRTRKPKSDSMTDDAAMLPESITGSAG